MARRYQRTKLPIPNDYTPETDWNMGVFCYPDTKQWRGIVQGAFYELTRGRKWDETTGTITDVQAIALQIYGELEMGCKDELTRIADGIEALNPDNGTLSFDDIIQALTDDGTYKKIKPFLTAGRTLLALAPDVKVDPLALLSWITQAIGVYNQNRHAIEQIHYTQLRLLYDYGISMSLVVDEIMGLLPDFGLTDAIIGDEDEYIELGFEILWSIIAGLSTNAILDKIADRIANLDIDSSKLDNIRDSINSMRDSITQAIDNRPDTQDELTAIAQAITDSPDTQNELTTIAQAITNRPDTQDELTAISTALNNALMREDGETDVPYLSDINAQIMNASAQQHIDLDNLTAKVDFTGLISQLRACCANSVRTTGGTPDSDYGACDDSKCRKLVLALGNVKSSYLIAEGAVSGWEEKETQWGGHLTLSWMSDVISDTLTSISATYSELLNRAADVLAGKIRNNELSGFIDAFSDLMPDLLCAFYSHNNMGDAMDAAKTIIQASSMSDDSKQLVEDLLESQYMLGVDISAHPPKWGEEAYFNTLESYGLRDWYTGDCSECGGCSGGAGVPPLTLCSPPEAGQWIHGTPSILDGQGYPRTGQVVNSVSVDDFHEIEFILPGIYNVNAIVTGDYTSLIAYFDTCGADSEAWNFVSNSATLTDVTHIKFERTDAFTLTLQFEAIQ